MNPTPTGNILLYQTADGQTAMEVQLQQETVWLSLNQLVELFQRDKSVLSRHLKNVFDTDGLNRTSVVANFATTAADGKTYLVAYYNLDVIISIGYRVNSKRGTQFRQWATSVLRQYLVQGYALNEKRLREQNEQLQSVLRLVQNVMQSQHLDGDQANSLLRVIQDYRYALAVLDDYDHQRLTLEGNTQEAIYQITYEEAQQVIEEMKEQFGGSALFGREKDASFQSSVATIYQSFGGEELYPSLEEKAANLLYFVVKNHSFSDGNKRIAAVLFTWFLDKNRALYRPNGSRRLADNALVALTLMIAESKAEEKETMVKVIVNLINGNN
ncbi:MAG: virulence protein RhuM/Fic/DOC family protein [Bacteroidota bacterium]